MTNNIFKVAVVTGGAKRIGAIISQFLHQKGMSIVVHCHSAVKEAEQLVDQLNEKRNNSAMVVQGDLKNMDHYQGIIQPILQKWGRLDVLINNASIFYSTPYIKASFEQFDELLSTNLKAPFFLTQAALEPLQVNQGCVINITDIHAQKPLKSYSIYTMSKAALKMMTESLAKELAPDIRVNAVAPGAILWPENEFNVTIQEKIIEKIPLKQQGKPIDIAKAVWFLIDSDYVTGQTIIVDGGRLLD